MHSLIDITKFLLAVYVSQAGAFQSRVIRLIRCENLVSELGDAL